MSEQVKADFAIIIDVNGMPSNKRIKDNKIKVISLLDLIGKIHNKEKFSLLVVTINGDKVTDASVLINPTALDTKVGFETMFINMSKSDKIIPGTYIKYSVLEDLYDKEVVDRRESISLTFERLQTTEMKKDFEGPTHKVFVSDNDIFNGNASGVSEMMKLWGESAKKEMVRSFTIRSLTPADMQLDDKPFYFRPTLSTVYADQGEIMAIARSALLNMQQRRSLKEDVFDVDVTLAYPCTRAARRAMNPDLVTSLHFYDEPFDISLLKFDTEEGECGTIYYDDEYVVSDDEEPELEFLNQLLCENAWACGCGMPDQATAFFFKQLIDLDVCDHHSLPGGLELFKIACYEKDIIDEHSKLTAKGTELIAVFDHFNMRETDWFTKFDMSVTKVFLRPGNANLKPLTDGVNSQGLVFRELTKPIPKQFDANKAMLYVGIFCSFLDLRSKEWNTPGNPDTIQNIWKAFQEKHYGETYNSLHILDNVLELEEHGGSTPGWLNHTLHAEQSLVEIEKLYGVKELFKLFLEKHV